MVKLSLLGSCSMSPICFVIIVLVTVQPFTPCIAVEFSFENFLHDVVFTGSVGPLLYSGTCRPESGYYSNHTSFQSDLSTAFTHLTAASALRTFSNTTTAGDEVHASFYCLPDIDPRDCHACVGNMSRVLSQKCYTREAIVYSDACVLRYSDLITFTEDDSVSALFCGYSGLEPGELNRTIVEAMDRVLDRVGSSTLSGDYYYYSKAGEDLDVQCAVTDGGGSSECKDCLLGALNETSRLCLSQGATWGYDYRPSCRITYHLQPSDAFSSPLPSPVPEPVSEPSVHHPVNMSNSPGNFRLASLLKIITAAIVLRIKDFI